MNQDQKMRGHDNSPLSFLVFSGSLREESLNTKLARLAVKAVEHNKGIATLINLRDYDLPSYNLDIETDESIPANAEELKKLILGHDAFIIASPEYNGSMPGHLKNAIDWVSRFRPQPFNERHALLLSASPSMAGGNRGLWALRVPFEHLGARVFPDMFSLATAHKSLTTDGEIADETLRKRFEMNIVAFMDLVEAAKHYPCMKKAWIEFLGEKPDPVTERVE